MIKISLTSTPALLATRGQRADSFISRAIGLLGRSTMGDIDALIIPHCKSVHMFGMRFAIDVVFCNREHIVVHLCHNLRPWQVSGYIRQAHYCIEVPCGTIATLRLTPGERLSFSEE